MTLKEFLGNERIFEYSLIPFNEISIINSPKLDKMLGSRECLTVVPFLIPYLVRDSAESNISIYAHARDYHFYFEELSARAKELFPELVTACDNSPINEVECAVKSGLGSIGKNGLLLNRRYGSYAFIAEFFFALPDTDKIFEGMERRRRGELCRDCGACRKACPNKAISDKKQCVSYINQKKKLDEGEEEIIAHSGMVWGCDICQKVCPYNINAEETEIDFFKKNRTPYLDMDLINSMTVSGEFSKRAYAWRGEAVVRRNIELCKK